KRLTGAGNYKWPRNQSEVQNLSWKQFEWLMDGLEIHQPKAIKADGLTRNLAS
ncbi:MAG: IS66 family insertion sequence element accessory protein TnpB, partial [Lachnospiraceae bacterium]|nr:IS66 family insertion sequence element accessory protein TnpB [Lachnospiraceae bacterium]